MALLNQAMGTLAAPTTNVGGSKPVQVVDFSGGQWRNRTADASLFRACISHCYLLDSACLHPRPSHQIRPIIGTRIGTTLNSPCPTRQRLGAGPSGRPPEFSSVGDPDGLGNETVPLIDLRLYLQAGGRKTYHGVLDTILPRVPLGRLHLLWASLTRSVSFQGATLFEMVSR
jgi:hypothetical protein